LTGISCVITVSRERGPATLAAAPSVASVAAVLRLLIPSAFEPVVHDDERTVSARSGILPFFVRRSWAEVAPVAERRARWSAPMGTSRLMTPELDWRV
jgi:hypothetical protein